jgi:small subunit ribosomal protein S9
MKAGSGKITVNDKKLEQYFPLGTQQTEINSPFVITETTGKYDVMVNAWYCARACRSERRI